MIGVSGIGGVPEPVGGSRASGQSAPAPTSTSAPSDDQVQVSAAAQVVASDTTSDVREDRVAEARQQIEDGTYQLQEVVTQVAARLSKFVG